jgi:hypothetical protein
MGNPEPGAGYPNYTGYENDPWGNLRDGIGAVYMGTSATPEISATTLSGSCNIKEDYITVCGPNSPIRFTKERLVDLVSYLPSYLSQTETYDLLKFFEDYWNTLFTGTYGYSISESATTSGDYITYHDPSDINTKTISISEKINRITEMQDVQLIDIELLQYLADNFGYSVNISRGELGSIVSSNNTCSANDTEKYLRFIISNIPEFYRIKTTKNAVKVMLFSWGLIGTISQYYTSAYSSDSVWLTPDYDMITNEVKNIPKTFFPTSHFIVWINLNNSITDLSIDYNNRQQIVNAIESVRPVNSVFHSLGGFKSEQAELQIGAQIRFRRYIKIPSDGNCDYWNV